MTIRVTASAPGKIVLSGEYAVLDGAPAVAFAINRRAHATLIEIDGDVSRVRAPGYSDVEGLFTANANGITWLQGQQEYMLVDAAWRATAMELPFIKLIELDSSDFIDATTRQKTGIGSSAAMTVALCAALTQASEVGGIARQAHAELQHGVGSGIDIACSNRGGLIEYCMADSTAATLQWPEGLLFQVLWTGVAVSTTAKLESLQNEMDKPSRPRLLAAAKEMATMWREGDAQSIIAHYHRYNKALHDFSVDYELDIFGAGHAELKRAAANYGLAYKPCGAGGGDVGIVLGTDAAKLKTFVREQTSQFTLLDCALDNYGVRMETIQANEI